MSNLTADIQASILKAKNYVDALTIKSLCNIPKEVVSDEHKFFSWDNEKRTPSVKPYLFDWSYYNGVVMEGLYDTYEARPDEGAEYKKYVLEYLNAMLVTDENGVYKFENIDSGKYMIVFEYDNVKYRNTEYHANKATESTNSDVITSKVSINNDTKKYAVTDTLELTDKELENIDAGFIENEVFDLNLNKYVSRITVQNKAGTTVKEYNKEQLAKLEIDSKQLAGSTVLIEYEIRITNEGELPGYANEIVDYIPTDLKFSSEINKDWYISTDGNLHNTSLTNDVIDVGETKILTLTLTKTMTENNTGTTVNTAEIAKASNELSIPDKDSTPGNKVQGEDDMSTAEVIISIRTGLAFTIGTIVVIIILAVGGTVIYTIKRKEANHEN